MNTPDISPLRRFVLELGALLSRTDDEALILKQGGALLKDLVSHDDWLPDAFAQPDPERYRQYLLHCDPLERFSVVSFVWGPGQATPIHDHTVWGLVGVLRGAELSQAFTRTPPGLKPNGAVRRLLPGDVEAISPRAGDIHQVSNAFADRASVSIHAYGGNIGAVRRGVYDPDGGRKLFVSGYSNPMTPNLWDRSAETRQASAS